MGTKAEGAKLIGQRFVDKKLPSDLLPQVSEALRKHVANHPELGKLLTEVMRGGLLLSLDPQQVDKVRQLVLTKGNPQRGKAIYLGTKSLNCVNCHKLEGVGGQVGPDLTKLWDTSSIEKIMESIIDPSKEIKEGYQSFKVVTTGGQTYLGLKVIDKPAEIVIRDANGKDVRIVRDDIDELAATKVSLMPEGVVAQLTFDQFIDLVSFLKNREAQESLRGAVTEFWTVGPFPDDPRKDFGPETKTSEKESYDGPKNAKLTWQPRSTEPNGYLDLGALFGKDKTSAYAMTYVFSPKEQQATMQIGGDDQLRAWINGKMVHEFTGNRVAKVDEDKVKVDLKQGWNPVLVKVVNRNSPHGLYLRFVGDGIRSSVKRE